jgi:hypothetical protein
MPVITPQAMLFYLGCTKLLFMKPTIKLMLVGLIFTAACSSSKITNSWKAENVQPRQYKKILVLGLINEPDRSIRENMEINLVANLRDMGYNATCSCDEYDPKAFENLKEQEALAKLDKGGVDAVLTIVLLDKTKEKYYIPGRVNYSPYAIYHNRFWGYYTTMHDRVYSKGYYVTDTKYFWETNFYSIDKTPQLLYSAQSQSFDPQSTSQLTYEYGQMIIEDLVKKNVIKDQKAEKTPLAF